MGVYAPSITSTTQVSTVATSETTASATYVALATAQAVTVNVGTSGIVMVCISCFSTNPGAGISCYASVALSGNNTVAAADGNGTEFQSNNTRDRRTVVKTFTGLTSGSTTFTMQFRSGSGTSTFRDRELAVIPL